MPQQDKLVLEWSTLRLPSTACSPKLGGIVKGRYFDVYTPQALNRKQLLPDKENTEKFKCV